MKTMEIQVHIRQTIFNCSKRRTRHLVLEGSLSNDNINVSTSTLHPCLAFPTLRTNIERRTTG